MDSPTPTLSPGRRAYDYYGEAVGGLNFRGDPLPTFDALPDTIRSAWESTAFKLLDEQLDVRRDVPELARLSNRDVRAAISGWWEEQLSLQVGDTVRGRWRGGRVTFHTEGILIVHAGIVQVHDAAGMTPLGLFTELVVVARAEPAGDDD